MKNQLVPREMCKYNRTNTNKPWPLMNDIRTEIIMSISKDEWLSQLYYNQFNKASIKILALLI